jgi:hypothetical protein
MSGTENDGVAAAGRLPPGGISSVCQMPREQPPTTPMHFLMGQGARFAERRDTHALQIVHMARRPPEHVRERAVIAGGAEPAGFAVENTITKTGGLARQYGNALGIRVIHNAGLLVGKARYDDGEVLTHEPEEVRSVRQRRLTPQFDRPC